MGALAPRIGLKKVNSQTRSELAHRLPPRSTSRRREEALGHGARCDQLEDRAFPRGSAFVAQRCAQQCLPPRCQARAHGACNELAFGCTVAPELARRTQASNGSTSPVASCKSAALNSRWYSVGRLVSSGLNARTIVRPLLRQNPKSSRIFSIDFTVTRILLSACAAMCSPAYSGSESRPSSTAPFSTCPQLLRPGKSTRSNDSLSTWSTETPGPGSPDLASSA